MKKRWASFLNQYKLDDQAIKLVTQAEKEIFFCADKSKSKNSAACAGSDNTLSSMNGASFSLIFER